MSPRRSRSVVLLGMMTKMPVPGVTWQTVHYLVGLRRLGYDVTYVEAHARTPSMFVGGTDDAGSQRAADYIDTVLRPFGLGNRWAYHALHHDGALYGMDMPELRRAYASADVILNLCGGTRPRPEHVKTDRLMAVITDPVQVEVELWQGREETRRFLDAHSAVFTFGENYGRPEGRVPVSSEYELIPTRQPVVLDFWHHDLPDRGSYTTVANWSQPLRRVRYRGEVYHWSKDREFRKFLDLPGRSNASFELALASFEPEDRRCLEDHGWAVRNASDLGMGGGPYRKYIRTSRGEFTVAKDQNVRLRSGWFSDRSASYLAAGRPVITQDTGFDTVLPTGRGLFPVMDVDDALDAIEAIEADYASACRAARDVARGHFDYRIVLPRMLAEAGVEGPAPRFAVPGDPLEHPEERHETGGAGGEPDPEATSAMEAIPRDLVIEPRSRRPLRLPLETAHTLLARSVPTPTSRSASSEEASGVPTVSVVVVTHGNLPLTRLCLETLLANTRHPAYEVVVVDNASSDGTRAYLKELAAHEFRLRMILNPGNEGFAAACNQGVRAARGETLVFLNNDTILPPGWLRPLVEPLTDPTLGAVNPVTNRSGNDAEILDDDYRTYGEFLGRAEMQARQGRGSLRPTDMLAFFCLALSRDTWERVGELDEGYGIGLFEDDDYSIRLRREKLRLACVEGVLVHHFKEASFGDLVTDGTYARLYERNRARFEEKWGDEWRPRYHRGDGSYESLVRRVRRTVRHLVPEGATVAVVSRGDDRLLHLDPAAGWHFPRQDDGTYAGFYPADDSEAVDQLRTVVREGARYFLVPRTGFWWLKHYEELRRFLGRSGALIRSSDDFVLYRIDGGGRPGLRGEAGAPQGNGSGNGRRGSDADGSKGHPSDPEAGSAAKASTRARPVFIIGSPRSGTSVLTWALGQHPNLYPLEETVWFGRFHAGAVQAYRIGSSRGEYSQLSAMEIDRAEFLETLGTAVDGLIKRHRSWPSGPIADDQPYARARSPEDPKARWVDGTPENSFHVDGILELFPEARFIHLLRESRYVARSLQRFHNIGGRRHATNEAYRKWISHVRACVDAERSLGDGRVLRVLHRDLSDTPEAVLRACLEFLGESYDARCLLPLRRRINSSGGTSLPNQEGAAPEEASPDILSEARALERELLGSLEDDR